MRATWLRFPPLPPRLPPTRLEQRYTELVLENESLAGNLTDAQYQPLLDRALKKLHTWAALVRALPPSRQEPAMEAAYRRVVGELRAEVRRAAAAA